MLCWIVKAHSPLVTNGLAGAIILGPACTSRILTTEPFLQLVRRHVDELIELSVHVLALSAHETRLG